ncbi:MAG: 3D (Asp-Asp-Asp) domain-containing protein [Myxococcota bacterium]|jgi:3D (Asp-Asp-Asp) domain-containing protein
MLLLLPAVFAAEPLAAEPLADTVRAFALPEPDLADLPALDIWSTQYCVHEATEIADGVVVRGPDEAPFPAESPIHLSQRDFCYAALEGSAWVRRLDGSRVTINYAGVGELSVDCGPVLGNSRWRTQGTVRFGLARGPYGDGAGGYILVPYRTLAVDPGVIPHGTVVYIPQARGVVFELNGETFTHDGYFFAADVGGAIRDHHIDTFTADRCEGPLPHVTNIPAQTAPAILLPAGAITETLEALHR